MPFFCRKMGLGQVLRLQTAGDFTAGFTAGFICGSANGEFVPQSFCFFVEEHDDAYGWTIERVVVTIFHCLTSWGGVRY